MPRANRHFLPGFVRHITHRCHKREFLIKFARDRRRWPHGLFEARKRFGRRVLNDIVTSNRSRFEASQSSKRHARSGSTAFGSRESATSTLLRRETAV